VNKTGSLASVLNNNDLLIGQDFPGQSDEFAFSVSLW
jgi:hypothetical protein